MQKASWPVSWQSVDFFFCLAELFSFFFDSAHPGVNAGHLSLGKEADVGVRGQWNRGWGRRQGEDVYVHSTTSYHETCPVLLAFGLKPVSP